MTTATDTDASAARTALDRSTSHLVRLPGGVAAVWRPVGLRSAGFPVTQVERLADRECAESVRRLADLDERTARERFRPVYASCRDRISAEVRGLLRQPEFRRALLLQNHPMVARLESALFDAGRPRPVRSRQRQAERTIAIYWQRYTTKNDTIAWFGPFAWAAWTGEGPAIRVRPGRGLVARSLVCFESWAVDALCAGLAADPGMQRWLVPRMLACLALEGTTLHRPYASPVELGPGEAAVLGLCDGARNARELARAACRLPGSGLMTEAEVLRALRSMQQRGWLTWDLDLALSMYPEREFRSWLERVGDQQLRGRVLADLERLLAARSEVAESLDDPLRLEGSLTRLDEAFSAVTGERPTRRDGEMYAGRTLVFVDCVRDVRLDLGPALLDAIAPLSLLVTSARWLTSRLAAWFRSALEEAYEAAVARTGARSPSLASREFTSLLSPDVAPAAALLAEHADRWWRLLAVPPEARRVRRSAGALQAGVESAFPSDGPGWPLARYHAPDLLVAARGEERLRHGDFEVVLGEFHVSANTLLVSNQLAMHPEPEALTAAYESDLPRPCVVTVLPKHWPEISGRLHPKFESPLDLYLSFGPNSGGYPAGRGLPLAGLVLTRRDGRLAVTTRDGSAAFDPAEVFGMALGDMLVHGFALAPPAGHVPRVTVDRLVLLRESWRMPPEAIDFAHCPDEADGYLTAVRWAAAQGMPRRLFLRTPCERKPILLDFESPLSVAVAGHMLRRAHAKGTGPVALQEMHPDPEHTWLPDAAGNRYTAELRMALLDGDGVIGP